MICRLKNLANVQKALKPIPIWNLASFTNPLLRERLIFLIPIEEKEKIKGSKILVLNALQKQPHISHYNLEEALDFISEVNPGHAYLTHISHLLGFHAEVQQRLPKNVSLAYDMLTLTL